MYFQRIFATIAVMALTISTGLATAGDASAQSARDRLSDSTIESLIEYRLNKNGLQRADIDVKVEDGVVILDGKVRTHAEKRRASRLIHNVDGVVRVENMLEVEAMTRTDQQVADEIAKEVRSFVFYDIFDWIEGTVNNGVVTLKGEVREPWRKDDYARLAEDVSGVKEVRNDIEVLPTSIYDDQLRVAAARAIYGHPSFRRYAHRALPPIHIIVENGRIELEGSVATQLERQLAETLVRSNVMSFEVMNNLKVDQESGAN
jgi:hyperosmotically inducible periplasmic protein